MATRRLGIIMHGVTGRMGTNQHLVRSILAIRADGGVRLANGDTVIPDPILVGRNADKLEALAKRHERRALDHRSCGRARRSRGRDFLRRRHDADAPRIDPAGDRGRQAHLLREAERRRTSPTRCRSRGSPKSAASRTASCRTSSSCPGC